MVGRKRSKATGPDSAKELGPGSASRASGAPPPRLDWPRVRQGAGEVWYEVSQVTKWKRRRVEVIQEEEGGRPTDL